MKKHISIILLLILCSCKESIVEFSEIQPRNSKDIQTFPKKLIGSYYTLENDENLKIDKHIILRKIILTDTLNIKELSEFEILKDDSITDLKKSEKFSIRRINDSLFTDYVYIDTLFKIDKNNVLRKMNDYYFLNSRNEESWTVKKLYLRNGQLSINAISTREEVEMLQEITESKTDELERFVANPTKKEFKEFIKRNGFTKGEIYLKK